MLTDRLALRLSSDYETGHLVTRGDYAVYQGQVMLSPQLFRLGEFAYFHLLGSRGGLRVDQSEWHRGIGY